jgi:3-methyladenine DNA glycosylase/8-oxoguanine DNA glycosylase
LSRLRYSRQEADRHLSDRCERLGDFIGTHGPLKLKADPEPDLFCALAQAIVYQQLSGKAAATIYGRFTGLFSDSQPNAQQVGGISIERLRSVGLSQNKALAIQDLAVKSLDGSLATMSRISRMSDAEVVENLIQVRGIGPWTAQMLLIFNLGRPDVMPANDLGVQKGVQLIYRMRKLPTPYQVLKRTRHLAPYRSAACWYFWRAADTFLMT